MKITHKTCQICGAENVQGNHFDVSSCRACAVFFRRHAGTKYSVLECQSVHCNWKRFFCKPCRLKRCYEAGMNIKKFQYNRDALKFRESTLPTSFNAYVGRPSLVLFCTPDNPSSSKTVFVDLNLLIQKAGEILDLGAHSPLQSESQLKKLAFGFECQTTILTSKSLVLYKQVSREEMFKFWEYYLIRISRWLVYFDEFQKVSKDMKIQLISTFWHVFGRLDKMAATAKIRKFQKCLSKRSWAMSNGMMLDVERTKTDFSWMSSYPFQSIFYFLSSLATLDLEASVTEMEQMGITVIELNYLLAQLCFEYTAKRCQSTEIQKHCEHFQKVLADDLHEYYVKDMRMTNYSGRLIKLLKINNAVQKDIIVNRPRFELAALFNVFTVEFSHPDMFFDTGLL